MIYWGREMRELTKRSRGPLQQSRHNEGLGPGGGLGKTAGLGRELRLWKLVQFVHKGHNVE